MSLGLGIEREPSGLVALPAKLLSVRRIELLDPQFAKALGVDPKHASAGLVTCDSDDALYVALDHATKAAEVEVVFARSFYAGARHASGPYSGEALGVLAGADPELVAEALWALREGLENGIHFHTFEGEGQPAFFAKVIGSLGFHLSKDSGLEVGSPMAYLVAPPMEAMIAVDAALKSARVRLVKWMPPPTETNFAAAYLSGELAELEAAAVAFVEAIRDLTRRPLDGMRRPMRLRR